jgi:hypothetical protein
MEIGRRVARRLRHDLEQLVPGTRGVVSFQGIECQSHMPRNSRVRGKTSGHGTECLRAGSRGTNPSPQCGAGLGDQLVQARKPHLARNRRQQGAGVRVLQGDVYSQQWILWLRAQEVAATDDEVGVEAALQLRQGLAGIAACDGRLESSRRIPHQPIRHQTDLVGGQQLGADHGRQCRRQPGIGSKAGQIVETDQRDHAGARCPRCGQPSALWRSAQEGSTCQRCNHDGCGSPESPWRQTAGRGRPVRIER